MAVESFKSLGVGLIQDRPLPAHRREIPILFRGRLVRAIQKLIKTETRRLPGLEKINKEPDNWELIAFEDLPKSNNLVATFRSKRSGRKQWVRCRYGRPGDTLWVRENFKIKNFWPGEESNTENGFETVSESHAVVVYMDGIEKEIEGLVDNEGPNGEIDEIAQAERFSKKKGICPSIHMPRWASRMSLQVTEVRIERLIRITNEEAKAEGVTEGGQVYEGDYVGAFCTLWIKINGSKSWYSNPWVWVVKFKLI